jgi:DNA-binding NarL/FixJ family response regulator
MAISRGRELLNQSSPSADEVKKSIVALQKDAEHLRKCIKAGLRDYDSGQASIDEISDIIQQLRQKL